MDRYWVCIGLYFIRRSGTGSVVDLGLYGGLILSLYWTAE